MAGTVTVYCKLPHGLILRVFDFEERTEYTGSGGGTRTVKVARELPKLAILNGWSHPQNQAPGCLIVNGFAVTPDVDKDLWDLWLQQNATADVVKNGLIFAHEKAGNGTAESKEKASVRSGLERLDPKALPNPRIKTDESARKIAA
jgi:hypothetical protein